MMNKALLYKILANNTGAEISASGNPATLPGTLKNNPMNEMKVFGRSKQETTTGAQLWEFGDIKSLTVAMKNFSTSLKEGKYTITADIESTDTDSEVCLVTIGGKYINLQRGKGVSATFELTEESTKIHMYASDDYNNSDGDTVSFKNVMLNAGDTALPYEPYTGGQPSPNPEYPQEIINAGMKMSTGKNLFSGFVFGGTSSRVENGIITTKEGASYIRSDYIPCEVGKHYVYNIPKGWRGSQTVFCNSDKKYIGTPKTPQSFNVPEDTAYFVFQIAKTDTTAIYQADLEAVSKLVQVEQADACTEYEPYTGGVPKLHGDKIDLEVHGKNLFNLEYAINQKNWGGPSGYWYIPYYVGKGNTVSITYGAEIPSGLRAYICIHFYPGQTDEAIVWLYHSVGGNLINNKCTFIAEADYIYLNAAGDYLSVIKKYMADLQIEVSPSPTAYEPYHTPQSLSIQTPNGLPTIPVETGGNYTDANGQQWVADYIDLKRGKYVQNIRILELTGQEAYIVAGTSYFSGSSANMYIIASDMQKDGAAMCNCLSEKPYVWSIKSAVGYTTNIQQIHLRFLKATIGVTDDASLEETKTAYKNYIKRCYEDGNPIEIHYILAEPIERDLTPSEIQAYQELTTYAGTTIVENDADCYMEVSAGGGDVLRAKKLALLLGD